MKQRNDTESEWRQFVLEGWKKAARAAKHGVKRKDWDEKENREGTRSEGNKKKDGEKKREKDIKGMDEKIEKGGGSRRGVVEIRGTEKDCQGCYTSSREKGSNRIGCGGKQ